MARKIGDLVAPNGSYQTKDGQQKTRWLKCGSLLQTDKGMRVKLDSIPIQSDGWFSVFEEDKKEAAGNDDMPF